MLETKVVALADSQSTLMNPDGIDVESALRTKEETGVLGGTESPESVISVDADIFIPAALEEQVRGDNVENVKADIVLEIANGPVTPEADVALAARSTIVIPDVLANAGGVTVSYFEWLQNKSGDTWTRERVTERLEESMQHAYRDVADFSHDRNVTLRDAAYAVALSRILDARKG